MVLIKKCIEAPLNFKMNEITSDNQKANRKINCGENYPTPINTKLNLKTWFV